MRWPQQGRTCELGWSPSRPPWLASIGAIEPFARLRQVEKRYRVGGAEVRALDAIDLEIAAGAFTAIVGPSGSGKSTLLGLIGALDRPTNGSIGVAGRELGGLDRAALAKHRRMTVGFVFQTFRLLPHLSARENVALPLLLGGATRDAAERTADLLLGRVGLGSRAAHRPAQLSGGEQQRVAIARALANAPRAILADEPTGNLDAATAAGVLDLLQILRVDEGLTMIVATHNAEVASRADHVVRLRDGRVVQPVAAS